MVDFHLVRRYFRRKERRMNEMLRRRGLFLIPNNMKLVETITLTQEYIDDAANYINSGGVYALRVRLSKQLEKNAIIKFVFKSIEDWYTSKPNIAVGINGLFASDRVAFQQQLTPTQYFPWSAAYLKCTALGDTYMFETIRCKWSTSNGQIYNQGIDTIYCASTKDNYIRELDIYFPSNTSGRLNAGTTIKIYSE